MSVSYRRSGGEFATYLVVSDTILLVCCAQRDGRNDRTRLWVWLRSYMNGTRPKAVERDVLLDGVDAVRFVRVMGGFSVVNDWRHG